ncbi:hypothetical protein [Ruegeria sp. MALMAid1280]|uniref:hypothetical protein n=1 Tax=Ruegeria sp. MALMAid1280 TaxID=3411634 RepID=UPI003BA3B64C
MQNKYLYRIYRLRRLILTSLIALFVPWAIGWQLFGPSALLESPGASVGVAVICTSIILSLVLVYPRVWWETVTTAFVFGLGLMFLPVIEAIPELAPTANRGAVTAWLIFGVVFGNIFLWLGLNWLPGTLINVPLGLREWKSRIRYDMPADRAFQVLKTTPDSFDGKYKTGPVGNDGLFTVSSIINTINPDTWGPESEELLYKCKIEQEGENSQVISSYYTIEGEARVDVERLNVRAAGQGAICETCTVKSRRNIYEDLGFWLQDYGADHKYSRLERSEGRPSVALVDLPYITPLVGLARFFEQFNENPPGAQR